jgi:hypothetical protein
MSMNMRTAGANAKIESTLILPSIDAQVMKQKGVPQKIFKRLLRRLPK